MTEAQWALVQMLDGVQRHDLPTQLGLPDDEISRIWSAYESARTALARPEPAGEVSDEEIRDLADFDHNFDRYDTTNDQGENGVAWECADADLIAFARAFLALALSRRAPVQPADGEVVQLSEQFEAAHRRCRFTSPSPSSSASPPPSPFPP